MRAWIEIDSDYGWGPARMLISKLKKDGYVVQEIVGTQRMLTLWASKPDVATVLVVYQ